MALGNKGFANIVANAGNTTRSTQTRLPPRTGILGERENRLAEMASGGVVNRLHELIDPTRCKIWDGHNRDYAALNEAGCADLIESFRAQGRQEMPAIVRRVKKDPNYDFEVICGARRHWTVTWLRANTYPDFKFLVEPRELTDEEAFRLADLENRNRKDLSDFERATDYARAIDRYYSGSQQKMAERLDVSSDWLSKYLAIAELPQEVLASFGSPHVIGIKHAATLRPLIRAPKTRERVLVAAAAIACEQAEGSRIKPSIVVKRIVDLTKGKGVKRSPKELTVCTSDGAVLVKGHRPTAGSASISILSVAGHQRVHLLRAVADLLDQMFGKGENTDENGTPEGK